MEFTQVFSTFGEWYDDGEYIVFEDQVTLTPPVVSQRERG